MQRLSICAVGCVAVFGAFADVGAQEQSQIKMLLQQYCFDCHNKDEPKAKIDLATLSGRFDIPRDFATWRHAADMIASGRMPPAEADQPNQKQKLVLVRQIRAQIRRSAQEHAKQPWQITLRRLTRAEYAYSVEDLTGLTGVVDDHLVQDSVGGEGFANVGSVQFTEAATIEQYLAAAKKLASHAVIGTGPIEFFESPGKTGFELSAINRIQRIYRAHGFRSASGEGGESFGLDRYERAFFAAWQYRYRSERGTKARKPKESIDTIARRAQVDSRFVEYIHGLFLRTDLAFPTSAIAKKWRELPKPGDVSEERVRKTCGELNSELLDWQNRFGENADAKEEAPVFSVESFRVSRKKPFEMNINFPKGTKKAHLRIEVVSSGKDQKPKVVVVWRKPMVQFRIPDEQLQDPQPLRKYVTAETRDKLRFGKHLLQKKISQNDFVTNGVGTLEFELPIIPKATSARLLVQAELDLPYSQGAIIRCTISQREDTDQGKQVSALLADTKSAEFKRWGDGVMEFAGLLPQVSHREPAPSDRDPIPAPFDNTYNNAERNHYHYKIKYYRDDAFLVKNILDDATRLALDQAWDDLLGSFEYHNAYLRFIAKKHNIALGERGILAVDAKWIKQLPAESQAIVESLKENLNAINSRKRTAKEQHLADLIGFAGRAWRRPLSQTEGARLRAFYRHLTNNKSQSHDSTVRLVLARILLAPEFLYRLDSRLTDAASKAAPLSNFSLANRLSYFLWSSVPDAELRRLAQSGELQRASVLQEQVRRMLKDPKSRRFVEEFFGQWLGFYRFDLYRGVDPKRFPTFDDQLKKAMYAEAISFFDYVVREDRPVDELLFADYTFVNTALARHYGLKVVKPESGIVRVDGLKSQGRGGLLTLGAVLTTTSAPLRTSPVKRGDWVLRRILGTPVPPPPADAGSIAADDVLDDGLTVRKRLEAHRNKAACRNCHARIDPLGFAFEHFDSVGRWRKSYRDGQPIETKGRLISGDSIDGMDGLKTYLQKNRQLFYRMLSRKLVGYALGRSESINDVELVDRVASQLSQKGNLAEAVVSIVKSPQFRLHQAGGEPRR